MFLAPRFMPMVSELGQCDFLTVTQLQNEFVKALRRWLVL
jgi:hypothetical protein